MPALKKDISLPNDFWIIANGNALNCAKNLIASPIPVPANVPCVNVALTLASCSITAKVDLSKNIPDIDALNFSLSISICLLVKFFLPVIFLIISSSNLSKFLTEKNSLPSSP